MTSKVILFGVLYTFVAVTTWFKPIRIPTSWLDSIASLIGTVGVLDGILPVTALLNVASFTLLAYMGIVLFYLFRYISLLLSNS